MNAADPLQSRWLGATLFIGILAFGVMLIFATTTVGTNDVLSWEACLRVLRSNPPVHLYQEDIEVIDDSGQKLAVQTFNYPPLMIAAIKAWGWLADETHIPFRVWLRASSSFASWITLLLICLGVKRGCWSAS